MLCVFKKSKIFITSGLFLKLGIGSSSVLLDIESGVWPPDREDPELIVWEELECEDELDEDDELLVIPDGLVIEGAVVVVVVVEVVVVWVF